MIILESKQFKKDFDKLSNQIKKKVLERLRLLKNDPNNRLLNIHKLSSPWVLFKSLNVSGDIRLIFQIDGENCVLARIGTHSELYGS